MKSISFSITSSSTGSVEDNLDKYEKRTKQYADRVGRTRLSGSTYYQINRTIQNIKTQMEKNAGEFDLLQRKLHEIVQLYEKTEQGLLVVQ